MPAPASMATPTPSQMLPVAKVTIKPEIAPVSIVPSTPRFSTPDRSVTSSPSAAYTMGVPATSVTTIMERRVSIMSRPLALREARARSECGSR